MLLSGIQVKINIKKGNRNGQEVSDRITLWGSFCGVIGSFCGGCRGDKAWEKVSCGDMYLD
jgi:hypothetical protein